MTFAMTGLGKSKSGAYTARKVIPRDVCEEHQRLFGKRSKTGELGKGHEVRFYAKSGTPHGVAKAQFNDWLADIETRISTIRAARKGEGQSLTHRRAHGLAGEWYRWYVAQNEDNPGKASRWEFLEETLEYEIWWLAPDWFKEDASRDPKWEWAREPGALAEIRPMVADKAKTAQFLASRGLVLTTEARELFLDALLEELIAASRLLRRRAEGDYSADERAMQFPKFEPEKPQGTGGKTCWALFEAWIAAAQPQASTVNRWRAVFKHLDAHFEGRAADSLTADETQSWAVSLVTPERSARTVADIWVTAARRVFAWALTQRLINSNPFAETNVTVPKKAQTRETKAFTPQEAKSILKHAVAVTNTESPFKAACRWVPWLCAYSGARGGEVTQLRGEDIVERDGIVAMRVTPEAGTVKTGEVRTIPIYEHLIEQGFLGFVRARGKGPLFYNPETNPEPPSDPTNPRRPRAVKARERLADWVRNTVGVKDPEVKPNHAWRHTFKKVVTHYSSPRHLQIGDDHPQTASV